MRKIYSDQIKRVVLTGGPKGGKSSLVPYVKEVAEDRGIHVLIAPEAATIRINGGISPKNMGMLTFQDYVLELQLLDYAHMEKAAESILSSDPSAKILILYDRGFLDGEAYIGKEEFAKLLKKYNLNRTKAGVEAYDFVVDMVTVGYGLPELFSSEGNEARYEKSASEARNLEDNIQHSWMDFEHMEIFGNQVDFPKKKLFATNSILNLFDEPPIEDERKFLLFDRVDFSTLPKNLRSVKISQTYLKSDLGAERVRRRVIDGISCFYWTHKYLLPGGKLAEPQRLIGVDEYLTLLERKRDNELRKDRHIFAQDHVRMELDIFSNVYLEDVMPEKGVSGKWPLQLLEIEGSDIENVSLPAFLGQYIEVTGDKRFANSNLAKIARV